MDYLRKAPQPTPTDGENGPIAPLLVLGALLVSLAVGIAALMVKGNLAVALVASVATLATVGALASTEAALYAVIGIACFDGLLKGVYPGVLSLILKDIFLGIALIHWLWDGLNGIPRRSLYHPMASPAILFTLYCTAQVFNSETISWSLALAGLRTWVIWIPIVFVAYDTIATRAQFERMILFIAVISAGTGVYGVIQQQIGFDHLKAISSGFWFYDAFQSGAAIRAPGTYVHPGTAGAAMSYAATVCLGVALASRAFSTRQILLLLSAPVCLVAMSATGSRAPLVGAVIGIGVFLMLTRRVQLLLGIAAFLLIGAWQSERFVGGLMDARYNRGRLGIVLLWDRSIRPLGKSLVLLQKRPLGSGVASGAGAGRGRIYASEPLLVKSDTATFIENEVGRAIKELGLPGVLLYMWLLWRAIASGLSGWRNSTGRDRWLASGLMAGACNLLIQIMVGSALYLAPGGIYFWLSCAIASKIPEYEAQDAQKMAVRSPAEIAAWQELASRVGAEPKATSPAAD